ncbi:conserved hypothetical protein [Oceanicaulis sp. 350]|nr:conserved hypothetical protein [Oceanicaulis sp. 350]
MNMKRQRGRGRKPGSPSNRSYESNGPDVKVRGAPSHIYDKYMQLARDASSAGDRVMAENYYQHAEHYLRIVQANQPKRDEREDNNGNQDDADGADDAAETQNETGSDNSGAAQSEESPRQRRPRGRRRRDEPTGSDDPLQVVDPESAGASSATPSEEGDSQPSTEEKPKKRTRTRRPKADVDAQKALDAADGEGEKRSSKDAGEAA